MKKHVVAFAALLALTFGCTASEPFDQFSGPQEGDTVAVMETSMGTIKIRLFDDLTPEMVKNFTTHAENGYYDNLIFHRVIEGFMIQGGDPNGNVTGVNSYLGVDTKLDDEIAPGLSHLRGAISMANSGPNTNGSQFFIMHADATYLDGNYSLFGQVYEGLEVVDSIAALETYGADRPVEEVTINSVEISTF